MDFTDKQPPKAYFAKLLPPLRTEIKALYQNDLPENLGKGIKLALESVSMLCQLVIMGLWRQSGLFKALLEEHSAYVKESPDNSPI
jgi:hypothetical protein